MNDIETDGGSFSWFIYLLNENLIEDHLAKSNESQAIDLISLFLYQAEVAVGNLKELHDENQAMQTENGKRAGEYVENNKIRCLKLLALKTASYLNWNLEFLNKNLPPGIMQALLIEWIRFTSNKDLHKLPASDVDIDRLSPQIIISLVSYHCWCLKFIVEESFPVKPSKIPHVQIPGLLDPSLQPSVSKEAILKCLQENEETSIGMLQMLLNNRNVSGKLPVMKSISLKHIHKNNQEINNNDIYNNGYNNNNNNNQNCDWSLCKVVSTNEIHCQISYTLGCMYFLKRRYDGALMCFEQCNRFLQLVTDPVFMIVCPMKCAGYLKACTGIVKKSSMTSLKPSVHEGVQECLKNNMQGLTALLVEDLILQELTVSFRSSLEEWALAAQRSDSLYEEVVVCNTIRRVMEGRVVAFQFVKIINYTDGLVEFFLKVCSSVAFHIAPQQREYLKLFLRYLCITTFPQLNFVNRLVKSHLSELFTPEELVLLSSSSSSSSSLSSSSSTSSSLLPQKSSFIYFETADESMRVSNMEQELLLTYDPTRIHDLVVKLHRFNVISLSDKWRLTKEMEMVLMASRSSSSSSSTNQPAFICTLVHVLFAKARLALQAKLYDKADELLIYANNKLKDTTMYKVIKLLKWEVLRADVMRLIDRSKNPCQMIGQCESVNVELVKRCHSCMLSLLSEPIDLQPSPELVCMSVACILNCEQWDQLTCANINNGIVQFGQMVAGLCKELPYMKSARTLARNFIETVALIFSPPSKSRMIGFISLEWFLTFTSHIYNETVLSLLISCLTKLYKLSDDDVNEEIFSSHLVFWPIAINNTMMVKEQLLDSVQVILDQSFSINNQQISWLRTQADLSYALKHYWSCMKYFVYLALVATEYFSEPITKNVYDDQVYKKMIHACIQLNLHTQAAVLCQFVDDVDYSTAFKCFQERVLCSDAMDSYYQCIWDATMLEYIINMHHRKGEIDKRNFAVKLIGKLEMNSNNRSDIQFEVSRVKKAQFMRMLCQQFLIRSDGLEDVS